MKVFAISDLHLSINNPKPMDIFGPVWDNYLEDIEKSWNEVVSDDDLVLLAGDLSWAMKLADAKSDIDYVSKFKGNKVIIRGNHDYWWGTISAVREALGKNFYAVQNDSIKIGDYIICGSRGWTVPEIKELGPEDKKIYDRELIRLEMSLKSAKEKQTNNEKIICMIHFPPFNTKREDTGFTRLFEKYGITTVVYGHLHGNFPKSDLIVDKNGVRYYLTSCDKTKNKLVEII